MSECAHHDQTGADVAGGSLERLFDCLDTPFNLPQLGVDRVAREVT